MQGGYMWGIFVQFPVKMRANQVEYFVSAYLAIRDKFQLPYTFNFFTKGRHTLEPHFRQTKISANGIASTFNLLTSTERYQHRFPHNQQKLEIIELVFIDRKPRLLFSPYIPFSRETFSGSFLSAVILSQIETLSDVDRGYLKRMTV
jgi:hypothetical protein